MVFACEVGGEGGCKCKGSWIETSFPAFAAQRCRNSSTTAAGISWGLKGTIASPELTVDDRASGSPDSMMKHNALARGPLFLMLLHLALPLSECATHHHLLLVRSGNFPCILQAGGGHVQQCCAKTASWLSQPLTLL